jgi:hypothetical protein
MDLLNGDIGGQTHVHLDIGFFSCVVALLRNSDWLLPNVFVHAVVLHFVADSSALHLTNYLGGDVYHVPVLLLLHGLHFGHGSLGIFYLKV